MNFRLPSPRPGLRALALAAALLSALAVSARAQDITSAVSPNIVTVGEPATYTITFHNSSAPRQIAPPSIDGLQFRGPSYQSSFNSVNGRMTSSASLTYSVFPQRPGSYSIAPPPFDHDGRRVTLDPVTLEVRPAATPSPDTPDGPVPLRLRATLEPASPYIHQSAHLTLEILSLPNINLDDRFDLLPSTLPATSCVRSDFVALDPDRIEADGTVYDRRRFQAVVRFTSAGTYTLTPGLRGNVLTRADNSSRRRRDPFESMFSDSWPFGGPSMTATPVEVSVPESMPVTVRPVPTANRPADYSGAVGRFSFTATATPSEVAVGEPVTVSIVLSGDGNISDVRPPFYSDTPAYKAYDAKLSGDAPVPTAPQGTKRFDQVVMPRTDALMELPALAFAYFDPDAETFRTLTAGPFPLRVTPAADAASSALLLAPSAGASSSAAPSAPAALVLATDIHYLKPIPAAPSLPQRLDAALRRPSVLLPAVLAPPAFLLLLWLLRRHHDRLVEPERLVLDGRQDHEQSRPDLGDYLHAQHRLGFQPVPEPRER